MLSFVSSSMVAWQFVLLGFANTSSDSLVIAYYMLSRRPVRVQATGKSEIKINWGPLKTSNSDFSVHEIFLNDSIQLLKNEAPSSGTAVFFPLYSTHQSAPVAWCLIPARWPASNWQFDNGSCQCATMPIASVMLLINGIVSLSVLPMERASFKYTGNSLMAKKASRNALCVVSRLCYLSFEVRNQSLTGQLLLSSNSWRIKQIRVPKELVCSTNIPVLSDRVNRAGLNRAFQRCNRGTVLHIQVAEVFRLVPAQFLIYVSGKACKILHKQTKYFV